jgi:RNA polymerase sigma-70 factor, ECF subfamily
MSGELQLDRRGPGDHIDRLYRAAWGLCGSRDDAEDLVQETFARALGKPRLLRCNDDIGYLLWVLRNTFFSQRRRPLGDRRRRRCRTSWS